QFIKNVPGRGYVFFAEVREVHASSSVEGASPSSAGGIGRPPRKKSADLGSSRCEVDIKRVIRRRNPARKPVKRRPDTTDMPFVSLILHALDLGDFLRQFLVAAGWDQLQVVCQEDLVLQFARRAAGDWT